MEELWIPIVLFVVIAATIIAFFNFNNKTKESLHKVVRVAMEKGVELSPEIVKSLAKPGYSRYGDLRKGILFTAFGLAVAVFGYLVGGSDPKIMGLSTFPIAIGLGYFIISRIKNGNGNGNGH